MLCNLAAHHNDLRKGRSTSGQYARDVPRAAVVAARDLHRRRARGLPRSRPMPTWRRSCTRPCATRSRRYREKKRKAGAVDFLDLLMRARDLVRDDDEVRHDFQRRFRYLLVDEFQDTDPLQAELLMLLAADEARAASAGPGGSGARPIRPGALFIVGDPKQSIYRFRRADVGVYREICDTLVARGAVRVRLRTSFRSVPAIQRAVNAAFSVHMTGDRASLQADYVELQPARADHPAQPAVIALPVPRAFSDRGNVTQSGHRRLTARRGGRVRALAGDGEWLHGARRARVGSERRRARAARHPRRRRVPALPPLPRLHHRRHAPLRGRARSRAVSRTCWSAARPFTNARKWTPCARRSRPSNGRTMRLSVFATLRGPFFAVAEEELLAWHALGHGFRPYHGPDPVTAPPSEAVAAVAQALATLRELNRLRNHRPDRRHHWPADRSHPRACRLRAVARRRAGAGQRPADRRAGAALRGRRRALVPRLRRRAARRGRPRAHARSADSRGGH